MAKGLGRGFDSLIPTNFAVGDVVDPGERVKNVEVSRIIPNPGQPRKHFDEQSLKELSASIKQHGIIQPLVVTPKNNDFRIVAGERRYRAAVISGLKKIPVIIRNHEELEELEIALVENVQRVDLSPLEQAISVARLRDQFSLSLTEIAKKLGKAETTVSNIIRLLQLPDEAVKALQESLISEGHGRAILALKTDRKLQLKLLNKIITQKLSVRDAESFVKEHKKAPDKSNKLALSRATQSRLTKMKVHKGFSTKVVTRKRGGSLHISFKSDKELDDILKQLEKK